MVYISNSFTKITTVVKFAKTFNDDQHQKLNGICAWTWY